MVTSKSDVSFLGKTEEERLASAVGRLKSLSEGEAAILDVVDFGAKAVPALRQVLFGREPSGIFQPRCRAAEALAAIGAFSVLAEFLRFPRQIEDPTERLGEEAVISAAGRAISRLEESWVSDLLYQAAKRLPLQGVILGLGSFARTDSIPIYIEALRADDLRLTAKTILKSFGRDGRHLLMTAALARRGEPFSESESHLRKRRSALALLIEIGVKRNAWRKLRQLMNDRDQGLALCACELCFKIGGRTDRRHAVRRLAQLRQDGNSVSQLKIDALMATASQNCKRDLRN